MVLQSGDTHHSQICFHIDQQCDFPYPKLKEASKREPVMPSVYDCAVVSEDVYESGCGNLASGLGWSRHRPREGTHGFYAALYIKGSEVVISYRGTDDLDDGIADAQMGPGIGRIPPHQSRQALAYYNLCTRYRYNIVAMTGHSLGGALAKIVSQTQGVMAVAFNAPYVGDLTGSVPMTSMMIRNYNSDRDPVSGATRMIGNMEEGHSEIITVPPPSITDHLIDAGIAALAPVPLPAMQLLHYHGIGTLRAVIANIPRLRQNIVIPGSS